MASYHINFPHWPLAKQMHECTAKQRAALEQFYAYHPTPTNLERVEVLHVLPYDTSYIPWRVLAPVFGFGTRELKKMCGADKDFEETKAEKARKMRRPLPVISRVKRSTPDYGIGPRTEGDAKLLKQIKREKAFLLSLQDAGYSGEEIKSLLKERLN